MIQVETKLYIEDNSGAKKVNCIKILKGSSVKYGYVGDFFVCSIKELKMIRKVKKGDVFLGLLLKTRKGSTYFDGSKTVFSKNGGILVKKDKKLLGNRLTGLLSKNIRKSSLSRLVLLNNFVLV